MKIQKTNVLGLLISSAILSSSAFSMIAPIAHGAENLTAKQMSEENLRQIKTAENLTAKQINGDNSRALQKAENLTEKQINGENLQQAKKAIDFLNNTYDDMFNGKAKNATEARQNFFARLEKLSAEAPLYVPVEKLALYKENYFKVDLVKPHYTLIKGLRKQFVDVLKDIVDRSLKSDVSIMFSDENKRFSINPSFKPSTIKDKGSLSISCGELYIGTDKEPQKFADKYDANYEVGFNSDHEFSDLAIKGFGDRSYSGIREHYSEDNPYKHSYEEHPSYED